MMKGKAEDGQEGLPGGEALWVAQATTGVTQEKSDGERTTSGL